MSISVIQLAATVTACGLLFGGCGEDDPVEAERKFSVSIHVTMSGADYFSYTTSDGNYTLPWEGPWPQWAQVSAKYSPLKDVYTHRLQTLRGVVCDTDRYTAYCFGRLPRWAKNVRDLMKKLGRSDYVRFRENGEWPDRTE